MRNNTLILCSSGSDAKWASQYISTHSPENIVIVATSPAAVAYCHTHNIPFHFLADYQHYDQPIKLLSKKILLKSQDIMRLAEKYAQKIDLKIDQINLISVLNDIISFQINDGLLIYETIKLIIKKHNPSKIVIPQVSYSHHVNSANNYDALAYYLQYYFKDSYNITTYKPRSREVNIWLELTNNISYRLKNIVKYIFYSIIQRYQSLNINHTHGKRRIVMQTGGIITSYYYDLYEKLSSRFDFRLITYKMFISQKNELYKHKILSTPFEAFSPSNSSSKIEKYISEINTKIKKMSNLEKELMVFGKLDQKLSYIIISEIKKLLADRLKSTLLKIKTNENILQKFQPDLILNTHDPSFFGTAFVLPAKYRSIRSLLLLHGIPLQEKPYDIYSDVIQIWGKKTRNYFNKLSENKHIFQTGFTKMDEYFPKSTYKNLKTLNQPVKIGFVLTVYHPFNSHLHKYLYEVFKELQQRYPQALLRFRFHEGFISNLYPLASAFNLKYVDCSHQPLDEFITDCDLLVVWDTSAILWCMILGKPIIHTAANWAKPMMPTAEYKACWNPRSAKELVTLIKKFVEKPAIYQDLRTGQKKFLEDYCGPLDGKATDRLATLITKLVSL